MKRKIVFVLIAMMCLTACGQRKKAQPAAQKSSAESVAKAANPDPSDPYQALVGTKFKDFSMTGMDGLKHRLSDYIGGKAVKGKKKYVLVDFWASWCRPCMMEMPNVKRNWEKYRSKGFDVVGVSLDGDPLAWNMAVTNNGYAWNQLCDLQGFDSPAVELYGVQYIPWNFLCDENGTIVAVNLRDASLSDTLAAIYE